MSNPRVKRVKTETPPETFHHFLQLPLHDLMVPGISKYMDLKTIFSFRCCSRYCKELAESALAAHRSVKTVKIEWGIDPFPGEKAFFRVITRHCRRLREIKLTYHEWLTDEMLIQLINNNPLLEVVFINYSGYSFKPKAFYPLVNCKNLTSLKLFETGCDDAFLEMLNQSEIKLTEVALPYCQGFTEKGVCDFFRKQPLLKYIALPRLATKFRKTLETITESCQDLRFLILEHYDSIFHDSDLMWFLLNNPKLEKIHTCCLTNFSDRLWDFLDDLNVSWEDNL